MPNWRYTFVVAESDGLERKVRLSLGPVLMVVGAVVTLPVLIGWVRRGRPKATWLAVQNQRARTRNSNFRQATAALSGQIDRSSQPIPT
jgi:hypothetical protein